MADAGITDHKFEIPLNKRNHRAVDDSDQREQGKNLTPRFQAVKGLGPILKAAREKRHSNAERSIRPELHDDPGEEHRGGRWRGDMPGGRPGVEWPEAREDSKSREDHWQGPHLERKRKLKFRKLDEVEGLCSRNNI